MTYDAWKAEEPPSPITGDPAPTPSVGVANTPPSVPAPVTPGRPDAQTQPYPQAQFQPQPSPPGDPRPPLGTRSPVTALPPPQSPSPSQYTTQPLPGAPSPAPTQPLPAQVPAPPSVRREGWSSFGATPSRPPTAGPVGSGPGQYLPPVSPPTEAPITAEPARDRGPRWGWRAFVSFVAGGLVAAAGFGVAQLNQPEPATVEATAQTTVPQTTLPPIRDLGPVPTVPQDAAEPAEFVATTLGPSVVQIDTDFGVGSGVIFGDGLILTNNHVIEGATSIFVRLSDGREFPGELLGSDENTDVAVVSVGPDLGLPIAQLATGEKARVGQIAVAIGSPFDLQQSVTAGIVSAVDRPIPSSETSVVAMIQTDAPINPGNSGGALADRFGRVIGINTSIQTDGLTSANVGVGFAIPIDTAIRIADILVAGNPIQPGFLGVRGEQTDQAGVVLTEVTADSAAEEAGLLVGDRVLTFNGAPITEFLELAGLVLANQAGDVVTMGVIRDGELIEIQVTLGVREN
ncbi:MAG: trypsin-like peptidase domain-containing protein [Actinomycetota bacterium]